MNEDNNVPSVTDQAKMRLRELQERQNPDNPPPTLTTDKTIRQVKGKPKKKKFSQELKEAMFSEDIGNGSVAKYVLFKVMIPAFKRLVSDMGNTAINMALGLDPKTRTVNGSHVANQSVYAANRDRNYNRPDGPGYYNRRDAVSEYEWAEEDAKDIYNQMADLIDRYGNCSLADVYSIMGLGDKIRTTDRNWGWTSMRGADVVPVDRTADRWIVDLPAARPLP